MERRPARPICFFLVFTFSFLYFVAGINAHGQRGLRIDIPLENDRTLYYAHRARFNALLEAGQGEAAEAAALFYYLNRTGLRLGQLRRGPFLLPARPAHLYRPHFLQSARARIPGAWRLRSGLCACP